MEKLKYYIELKDNESGEIIDLYGYDNKIHYCTVGFWKTEETNDIGETIAKIDKIANKLIQLGNTVINKENKVC